MPKNVTTQLQKQLTSQVAHSSCNPSQGSKAPEMVFPGMGAPKGPSLWAPPKLYLGNYLGNYSQIWWTPHDSVCFIDHIKQRASTFLRVPAQRHGVEQVV